METVQNVIGKCLASTIIATERNDFMTKLESKIIVVTTNEAREGSMVFTSVFELKRTTRTFVKIPRMNGGDTPQNV